jgi:hypothetical protein
MVSFSEGGRPHTRAGTVNIRIATNRMSLMSSLRCEVKVPILLIPDFPFMRIHHERNMPRRMRDKYLLNNKRLAKTRGAGETKLGQEIGIKKRKCQKTSHQGTRISLRHDPD